MFRKITIAILCGMSFFAKAQTAEFNDLDRFRTRSFGEIIRNNSIQGYYLLERLEKISKQEAVFQITLMDDNLKKGASIEIRRPKKTYLLETVFNNDVFVFHFYDRKSKSLELVSMDRTGKEIGSFKIEDPSRYFLANLNTLVQSEQEHTSVFDMGDKSFMFMETVKNRDMGFILHGLDNNMNKIWTYNSDPESKMYMDASVLSIDDTYTLLLVTERKAMSSVKFDSYLLMLDSKTGDVLYNFQMLDKNRAQLSVLNGFTDKESGEAYIFGEYYSPGDDVARDQSLGLYIQGVDIEGKTIVNEKYTWKGDIARLKRASKSARAAKSKTKDVDLVFFHRIIRAEDGNIYAVGEQYQKQFSAGGAILGAAALAMGGTSDVSLFELLVTNMVVIEFDKDFKMTDYQVVEKKKTNVLLPSGAAYYTAQRLGTYIKAVGDFDYAFTTQDKELNKYYSIYSDRNRKEEEESDRSDAMIGIISIANGEIDSRRIPLNTDASWFMIKPAKPGYVLITEYYRKGKRLKLHLEKVQ